MGAHEVPHVPIISPDLESILLDESIVLKWATSSECRNRIGVTDPEDVSEVTSCTLQNTSCLGYRELTVCGFLPEDTFELKSRDCRDGKIESVLHTVPDHPSDSITPRFVHEVFKDGARI